LIGAAALLAIVVCLLLFKELRLLCFDETFAASRGYPVLALDVALMVLVVTVTLIGLQAVGLILMVALLVIPASAARFWTDRMSLMALISAAIGALSSFFGAGLSAVLPRLPSGAMIVLVATAGFLLSLFLGTRRGILVRVLRQRGLEARMHRQHLLRAIYETLEAAGLAQKKAGESWLPISQLIRLRSWNLRQLRSFIRRSESQGLMCRDQAGRVRLTSKGFLEAEKITYDHRLWELYLTQHADIAPSQVDRGADAIEHVLDPEMIRELESLLRESGKDQRIPPSLHPTIPMPGIT